jgi:hypothetical protein
VGFYETGVRIPFSASLVIIEAKGRKVKPHPMNSHSKLDGGFGRGVKVDSGGGPVIEKDKRREKCSTKPV